VHHSQIQWPEIFVEWSILEITVDVEEECILNVLRGLDIRDPE
jgi:hypothetical protein